jgi:hypothetical protein
MRLARLWLLLSLGLCSLASAQRVDLPQGYPTDGQSSTVDLAQGIGSGVSVTYTYTREDDTSVPLFSCVRECEGGKHAKHDECDLSCDKACPARTLSGDPGHLTSFGGRVTELGPNGDDAPPRPHSEQLDRAYERFQFPSTWRSRTILARLTNLLTRTPNFYIEPTYRSTHWNETPCSTSTRSVKCATYTVTVQYTLYDDEGGKRTEGPKGTLRYHVLIPIHSEVTNSAPEINCKCERKQEGPSDGHGFLWQPKGEQYAYYRDESGERPVTGTDVASLVTNVTVHDMNNATLTYMTSWMGEVFFPAGWEFECEEGGGQGVQLVDDLRFMAFPGLGQIELSLAPAWSLREDKKVRVMCTQIDKPEPRPDMKYRLVPPRNALLSRAAQITKVSNFRGPWDQMRLWIASDQASYDKVADTLVLAPGPGSYVTALHELSRAGAIDPFDARYLALMKLEHLLEPNGDRAAIEWVLVTKLTGDRERTLAEVKRLGPSIERMFGSPTAADQLGLIATMMATNGAAAEALWILKSAVPEVHRAQVAALAGGVTMALADVTDPSLAGEILDWVEAQRPVSATPGLMAVNPGLPEPVRLRALELAKALRPGRGG